MAPKAFRVYWLWIVIPVIAVFELIFQWQIPRREPSQSDWESAVQFVAGEKQAHDAIAIAPDWVYPLARMYLGRAISLREFGRFDNTSYDNIIEISANGARSSETQGLPSQVERKFGRLTVRKYSLGRERDQVTYDFLSHLAKARKGGFKRVSKGFLVDHAFMPRYAIRVPLKRKGVSLIYVDVPLTGVLRGYGVIDYKTDKFNRAGPVRLSVSVNGNHIGEVKIGNHDAARPFELALPGEGTGTVRFDISARDHFKREFGFVADVRKKSGGAK